MKKNLDRQDSSSSRPASEDLETLKEVCADKNFIEFQDFLAWKIKTVRVNFYIISIKFDSAKISCYHLC